MARGGDGIGGGGARGAAAAAAAALFPGPGHRRREGRGRYVALGTGDEGEVGEELELLGAQTDRRPDAAPPRAATKFVNASFPFAGAGEPGPEPAAAAQESAEQGARPVTSKFIVEGMCCAAEERLIGRLLEPLEGVREVELCATTRLALVRHDAAVLSPTTILQALNGANMDAHLASVKAPGEEGLWARLPPWPVLVAAVLCAVSFVGYAPRPPASYFKWVAVGAIAFGLPPLAKKAWAGLRRGLVGIDLLMIVATVGALALQEPIDAGILVVLFNLAEWLEGKTLATARNSLGAVLALRPDEAEVLSGARPGPRPV